MTLNAAGNKLGDIHRKLEYYWTAHNTAVGLVPYSVLMGSDEIQWRLPKWELNTAM